MKILALRLFCLAVLLGASSWAVWGDDGKSRNGASSSAEKATTKQSLVVVTQKQDLPSHSPKAAVLVTDRPATPGTTPVAAPVSKPAVPATGTTIVADPSVHLSLSTLAPTPEMWFYEQMRQDYNNPALQSRLRGERAAAERRARMAARAWYGVSIGRPTANVTPTMYYYSPFWASNTVNPNIWTPRSATPPVVIEARRPATVSGFGVW